MASVPKSSRRNIVLPTTVILASLIAIVLAVACDNDSSVSDPTTVDGFSPQHTAAAKSDPGAGGYQHSGSKPHSAACEPFAITCSVAQSGSHTGANCHTPNSRTHNRVGSHPPTSADANTDT